MATRCGSSLASVNSTSRDGRITGRWGCIPGAAPTAAPWPPPMGALASLSANRGSSENASETDGANPTSCKKHREWGIGSREWGWKMTRHSPLPAPHYPLFAGDDLKHLQVCQQE